MTSINHLNIWAVTIASALLSVLFVCNKNKESLCNTVCSAVYTLVWLKSVESDEHHLFGWQHVPKLILIKFGLYSDFFKLSEQDIRSKLHVAFPFWTMLMARIAISAAIACFFCCCYSNRMPNIVFHISYFSAGRTSFIIFHIIKHFSIHLS